MGNDSRSRVTHPVIPTQADLCLPGQEQAHIRQGRKAEILGATAANKIIFPQRKHRLWTTIQHHRLGNGPHNAMGRPANDPNLGLQTGHGYHLRQREPAMGAKSMPSLPKLRTGKQNLFPYSLLQPPRSGGRTIKIH